MNTERYLRPIISEFLESRMVFLGGPRQVGKTTLALSYLHPSSENNPAYLNWDIVGSKKLIRDGTLPASPLIILDEIHKYKLWRNLVKGFYDGNKSVQKYIITGSARLDYYRKGGDSLLGRYRYLRLHPFSAGELGLQTSTDLQRLLDFGGFPEPFLKASKKNHQLWCRERLYRIVNDDITNLENLKDYSRLEVLAELVAARVGSLFSMKSLEEDLQVSQKTVAHWLEILERVYYVFRVHPYGPPKLKAIKKAPKVYLWDWSEVSETGARFENLVASQLLKFCHFLEDSAGEKMELRFLKDPDHREVDFVILKNKKALFAVECKTGEREVSKSIRYFKPRIPNIPFYQVHLGNRDYLSPEGVRVLPFLTLVKELGLP